MIYVRYGEANSLGFRPFMAELQMPEDKYQNLYTELQWEFPDGCTEVPAFIPAEPTGWSTDMLLNWATNQPEMKWTPVGKRWPLIGPPNMEAQAEADRKYHRRDRDEVHAVLRGDYEDQGGDGRLQPDTFAGKLHAVYDDAFGLCLRKHRDYGPLNIALAPGGPINGLRVRCHDKMARINHLVDNGATPENESLRDSWTDLLNYAAIAIMVLDGNWPGVPTEETARSSRDSIESRPGVVE